VSAKRYDASNRGDSRCKMVGAGIPSLAKFRAQMCATDCGNPRRLERGLWQSASFRTRIAKNRIIVARIATDRSKNLKADCRRLDFTAATWARNMAICSPLESSLPRSYSCCGNPRPRNLANDRITAPAILHRQFPCLLRHKFLTFDFLGVRQTRGGLFRPKLLTVDRPYRDTIPLRV
jgi:hypothetical protein